MIRYRTTRQESYRGAFSAALNKLMLIAGSAIFIDCRKMCGAGDDLGVSENRVAIENPTISVQSVAHQRIENGDILRFQIAPAAQHSGYSQQNFRD